MDRGFHVGPHGRWWNNPEWAQKLGLTPDQQKRMEAVFEQSRPSLMDLSSTVHKEETAVEPLLAADQPDEGKILAQIDRVAQARAELEKAYGRMLLGLRRVLTPDQWKTLRPMRLKAATIPASGRSQSREATGPGRAPALIQASAPTGSRAPLVLRRRSHSVPVRHDSKCRAFRRRGTENFLPCFR